MVLIALSRSRPRSVQAFDLKKASACSRLSHSVIATRLGGGGPSKPTTFPPRSGRDEPRQHDGAGICHDEGGGAPVTRRSAVQKMTVGSRGPLRVFADRFILGAIRALYSLRRRQRGQRLHAQDA